MSAPLVRHGWTIAFQPQLFSRQYAELKAEVKRLKQELDPQSFVQHPQVKLLAAVMEGIKERIAADPYASRFALTGPLRRYGRLKGLGLPDRYRLFFRPFEADGRRLLLIWGSRARTEIATTATPCSRAWCSAASCRRTGRACSVSSTPAEGTTPDSKGAHHPARLPEASVASNPVHIHSPPLGPSPVDTRK
jgi:toxin YhaV